MAIAHTPMLFHRFEEIWCVSIPDLTNCWFPPLSRCNGSLKKNSINFCPGVYMRTCQRVIEYANRWDTVTIFCFNCCFIKYHMVDEGYEYFKRRFASIETYLELIDQDILCWYNSSFRPRINKFMSLTAIDMTNFLQLLYTKAVFTCNKIHYKLLEYDYSVSTSERGHHPNHRMLDMAWRFICVAESCTQMQF